VLDKGRLDHATKAVLLGQPSKADSEDVAALYWQARQWAREVSNGE
jgi:hypothetical protein